jgi:hypothetical protein
MLETSRLCRLLPVVLAVGCAAPEPQVANTPAAPPKPVVIAPVPDDVKLAEEAKALLAQAETDVQRARARRALWLKAWEDLLAARQAVAAKEHPAAIRHAKRASELAQLGLEQLAYPAVK